MDIDKPGERLAEYLESQGLSKKEFCEMADLAYNNFVRVLNGKRPLGINVLDKVKQQLPQLNINWLLYNEGHPTLTSDLSVVAPGVNKNVSVEDLIRQIVLEEVNPRFERINKSLYILLKRDISKESDVLEHLEFENKKQKA